MAEVALKQERYIYSSPLAEPAAPYSPPQAVPGAVPRAIPRPAYKPRVSAFSVLGFMFIAALAVACMLSYIELTRISSEITGVKAVPPKIEAQVGISEKLRAQIAENNALRVEYERTFDLKEIERYATQNFGMVRTQSAIEASGGATPADKAVIPASARRSGGIRGFFESVTEYFNS